MSAPRERLDEGALADLVRRAFGLPGIEGAEAASGAAGGAAGGDTPGHAPGTGLVDGEGAVVAVDGTAALRAGAASARWPSPRAVRDELAARGWSAPPMHVGWPGRAAGGPVDGPVLVLLPTAGARADDAAVSAAAAAWARAVPRADDRLVVQVPLTPTAAATLAGELAAAYGGRWAGTAGAPRGSGAGAAVLFTGLSGAGKSTIAAALTRRLVEGGRAVTLLDGDEVRTHLSAGLGFSAADRDTNVRRIGWVAAQMVKHGGIAVCALIAPHDAVRRDVRALVQAQGGAGSFVLVHVATPLAECERRDRKGLYARARRGEVADFTGISASYQEPTDAELVLDTTGLDVASAVEAVLLFLPREPDKSGRSSP